jgi:hypothetical protein
MKYKRLIHGLIAIIILVFLMIYSFQEYDKNDIHIKKCQLLFESSDIYNNTEISFLADIYTLNKTNHTLLVGIQEKPYNYPFIKVNTGNLDIQNLKERDLIDITGILSGNNQMTATQIWFNEPWKADLIILRSIPAILFVFYLFFRTWRLNTTVWYFEWRKKNG